MLVSIVMPAYNRERYLADAIDSVLAQTYTQWELIVVDDGSTDSTAAIGQSYANRFPGRVIFVSQKNGGPTAARNNAIRRSSGKLIAFLDSDDLWVPTKLERQVRAWDSGGDIAFVYTGYEMVDGAGASLRVVRPDPRFQGDIRELLWTTENEILGPTMMIEREKMFRVGLFDQRLKGPENLDLRLKLANLGRVAFVDETLYRYRKHGASLTDDRDAMIVQLASLIRLHFGDSPPADRDARRLWRVATSNHSYWCGNLAFERMEFARAFAIYARSWPGSRRKTELLTRGLRCLLGRPGNSLIRRMKQQLTAA